MVIRIRPGDIRISVIFPLPAVYLIVPQKHSTKMETGVWKNYRLRVALIQTGHHTIFKEIQ